MLLIVISIAAAHGTRRDSQYHQGRGVVQLAALPPDQLDLLRQEQAPLRKWLDGGLTTAAVTGRGQRQLDGGVSGDGSVMVARQRQWRWPEGDKGCGDDSMRAVMAAAVDDGVGSSQRWSKRGEQGRGGTTSQNCRPSIYHTILPRN